MSENKNQPSFEKEKKTNKVIQRVLKKVKKLKLSHVVFSNEIVSSRMYFKIE